MESEFDDTIVEISGATYKQNVYLIGMHLRDATNILQKLQTMSETDRPDLLAKAAILFAATALESNLSYFSTLALAVSDAAQRQIYKEPELEYFRAVQLEYSKDAELAPKKQKQSLKDRLLIVPKLLGRAFDREFQLSAPERMLDRLNNAIERRDAIIHPSWNRYPEVGVIDAVDAVVGVLEYLDSVRQQFFPYMIGYMVMLNRYLPLLDEGGAPEPPPLRFKTMTDIRELITALAGSWVDAHTMFDVANSHETEGDSNGSMLTRAALVSLYSMVSAQLSILAKLAQLSNPTAFVEKDIHLFNEEEYALDDSGDAILQSTKQRFEDRATIVPMVISKRTCPNHLNFSTRGEKWFQNMFKKYFDMRNGVMHSKFGEAVPRVSKAELREAFESVHVYFAFLATAGGKLEVYQSFLREAAFAN